MLVHSADNLNGQFSFTASDIPELCSTFQKDKHVHVTPQVFERHLGRIVADPNVPFCQKLQVVG